MAPFSDNPPELREDKAGGAIRKANQGRKSKACLECRKLKIRCELTTGERKCRYCQRRNLACVLNRTGTTQIRDGQSSDSEESRRIDALREEIRLMKGSLDAVLARCAEHSPHVQATGHGPSADDNTQMAMTRENSLEPVNGDGNEPVTLEEPMGSLYKVTRLRNIRSNKAKTVRPSPGTTGELNDFISKGVISQTEAEELYNVFQSTLNHYLWVGLEQIHPSFDSIRHSSELLAATILTVTALHIPTSVATFDACYKEFLLLISTSMFSRYHSIDDVRGLCIAAFWLSEVSWKLSGHAIRIATELNLHQSFSRALQGDREHFLRARLWYMLYVCDHHFSIAYGRPPMVSESIQIREHELFLASPLSDNLDARILSQVSLMQILTRVYDRFSERRLPGLEYVKSGGNSGAFDTDESTAVMLSELDLEELGAYNVEIDQWRMRWYPRQPPNPFIGDFPRRGVVLFTYFAKLQINSFAVRGVSVASGRLSAERKELANMAVSAAVNILSLLQEEDNMRKSLVGTPFVFLMNVATKWNRLMGLNIEYTFVSRLLKNMVALLKTAVTSERHMLKHIARGLDEMLSRLKAAPEIEGPGNANPIENSAIGLTNTLSADTAWQSGFAPTTEAPITDQQLASSSHSNEIQAWGQIPSSYNLDLTGAAPDSTSLTFMDDAVLYQAFGTEATNDVYTLLSSQFQY
ncbi:hypothetical protein BDW69DRAFT_202541 [Aspergillus filifer]